jgi:energy-coupling factor transporter ATP-binding protein EcfA2
MLVSFSVSNFRSFDGEQTFSLVASNGLSGEHETHTTDIPESDSRVLRAAVLYGANGAGKSNLFKALKLLKTIAIGTRKKKAGMRRDAFRFGDGTVRPTMLDVQFIIHARLYRYGVTVDDSQVLEEWLARVSQGTEQLIFERKTGPDGEVKVELGELALGAVDGDVNKIKALASIGGPRNQSFLATAFATLELVDRPREFFAPYFWFRTVLQLVSPSQSARKLSGVLAHSSEMQDFAGAFLRTSGTGIDHLSATHALMSQEEFIRCLPPNRVPTLEDVAEKGFWEQSLPGGDVLRMEYGAGLPRYWRIRLQATHKTAAGEDVPLDISDESDGTRRLLQLLPALAFLREDPPVYVIDEIDRSLHPILVRSFLEYFLNSCKGERRQLIMTTHESSLLDQDLLRRDEIWFAEKNDSGATSLYSLLDFKVRKDLEIRKHYLQGRFGAIPFVGGLRSLVGEEQPA